MDIVIIAGVVCFLVVMAYSGYKRGFVKIATSMLTLVVALFLTSILVEPVSKVVKETTPMYEKIHEKVDDKLSEEIEDAADIEKLGIPDKLKDIILKSEATANLKNETVDTVSDMMFKATMYVIIFIISYIITIMLAKVLDIVSKLPGIKSLNRLAGLLVGLAYGLGYIWIAAVVVTVFSNMEWAQYTINVINANPLLSFIYEINPLMILLTILL
ncbi:MAG: hypothetical protein E7266_08330 [Lachnospiraceae bacterium]|nr:hypothetical protein [Lachnospiraceae bacterium]